MTGTIFLICALYIIIASLLIHGARKVGFICSYVSFSLIYNFPGSSWHAHPLADPHDDFDGSGNCCGHQIPSLCWIQHGDLCRDNSSDPSLPLSMRLVSKVTSEGYLSNKLQIIFFLFRKHLQGESVMRVPTKPHWKGKQSCCDITHVFVLQFLKCLIVDDSSILTSNNGYFIPG